MPDTFPRDELSVSDIAQLALVGPSAVSNWQKRYDDFPKPIDQDGRWHRFRTGDVLEWLKDTVACQRLRNHR